MKLEIKNLSKRYGNVQALNNITVTMTEGIYAILGANGSGKSTLLNLITDNVAREEGEILFNGHEIQKLGADFRRIVGFMPQQQGFYEHFSAKLFLLYMAELKGIPKKKAKKEINHLLTLVNLREVANKKLSGFSGGMRQRVLLAQALLGDPKILILDEPTAGLDPKERISFRNFISSLSTDKIILLSTHIVGDIECIADQVILLKKGKLTIMDTPSQLIHSIESKVSEISCHKQDIQDLKLRYPTGSFVQQIDGLKFRIISDDIPTNFNIVKDNISMEDVYLYYFECQ